MNNRPVTLFVINSGVGKVGNIGIRVSSVLSTLNNEKLDYYVIARDADKAFSKHCKTMGIFRHIPRILNGIRIYVYPRFNHRRWDILLFERHVFSSYKKLKKELENKKVIVHIYEVSPRLIKFFKTKGYKVVLDVPIAPASYAKEMCDKFKFPDLNYSESILRLEAESVAIADVIIAPSEFVEQEVIKLGVNPEKLRLVRYGTNVDTVKKMFDIQKRKEGLDYCFAGTINSRKGVRYLLDAWKDPSFAKDRLHLCGRLFPDVKKLLFNYKYSNVIMPGFVDTKAYFMNCDVYVFPSLMEGSSKSIFEAMNRELPVITTYESGSIIRDGVDGIIVNSRNSVELKIAMLKFKKDIGLVENMGKNAKDHVKEYTWYNYSKRIINLYDTIY